MQAAEVRPVRAYLVFCPHCGAQCTVGGTQGIQLFAALREREEGAMAPISLARDARGVVIRVGSQQFTFSPSEAAYLRQALDDALETTRRAIHAAPSELVPQGVDLRVDGQQITLTPAEVAALRAGPPHGAHEQHTVMFEEVLNLSATVQVVRSAEQGPATNHDPGWEF
jgi:hypothetical protein